jgi:hypothetical protein
MYLFLREYARSGGGMVGRFTSKVLQTVPGSPSVRATVPEAVAAILGAVPGSTLVWEIEPGTGKVRVSIATPSAKSSKRD